MWEYFWIADLGLVVVAFSVWLIWRKRRFNYFKNLNIPGPEPNILFGNLREIISKGPLVCHKEWIGTYGKVFGYFYGMRPVLMVADVDLLKNIQVKNFHNFVDRPALSFVSSLIKNSMTILRGQKWKRIRSIISPSFTTSKLRQISSIVDQACDEMMDCLVSEANTGKTFNALEYYQRLTMDVIGRAAFGIQTNVQRNENDPFLNSSKAILSIRLGFFSLFYFSFPELKFISVLVRKFLLTWSNGGKEPLAHLSHKIMRIVKERRSNPRSRRQDLMQLMIDAELSVTQMRNIADSELAIGEENDKSEGNHKTAQGETTPSKEEEVKMTNDELVDNAVLFFIAGHGTTSRALSFVTHFLVHHPQVQEAARHEISKELQQEGKLDYASVQKLRYLDQVISETIRLYPPVYLFVNRQAAEDIDYGSVEIKSGMAVQVPVYYLHHDESLWPDPETFDPERFAPENKSRMHPMAYQGFGAGPRNCIGMRFALLEVKMAIVKLLQKYRIVPGKETEGEPLKLSISDSSLRAQNGVWIRLEQIS